MTRGAWGGTGSRGGYHLRRPARDLAPPACPDCGAPMELRHAEAGRFLVPGSLPTWTCTTDHAPERRQE